MNATNQAVFRVFHFFPLNLKLERRHGAGLNRAPGKSAPVLAVGHGKATPVAVSQHLQVGAPTGSGPVSKFE